MHLCVYSKLLALPVVVFDSLPCCRVFTFSDDEEEEKRVVRSQKDKRCVCVFPSLSRSGCLII